MSQSDLTRTCTKQGGGGIVGELKNGQRELFKFHYLVDDPMQKMFWVKGTESKMSHRKNTLTTQRIQNALRQLFCAIWMNTTETQPQQSLFIIIMMLEIQM